MAKNEIDQAIGDLEGKIDKLQALYNQYFMGIEKLQPSVLQSTVERSIRQLRRTPISNTAQKFRIQTLVQRFNTLNNHWRRVCREIEEGTYKRHIDRAKRRQGLKKSTDLDPDPTKASHQKEKEAPTTYDLSDEFQDLLESALSLDTVASAHPSPDRVGLDLDEPFAAKTNNQPAVPQKTIGSLDDPFGEGIWPSTPQHQAPASEAVRPQVRPQDSQKPPTRTASPARKSSNGSPPPQKPKTREGSIPRKTPSPSAPDKEKIDARRAHTIFRTFVAARARCNEPTNNLTLDKLTKTLNKQYQAKGGDVDFKVVIKNGKAAIRTVPKKKE